MKLRGSSTFGAMFLDGTATWKDYQLIDAGGGEKLERFGEITLIRPEPRALWQSGLAPKEWRQQAHARFDPSAGKRGGWETYQKVPEEWSLCYRSETLSLNFQLALTRFKHVGVFPEQAVNWEFIHRQVKSMQSHDSVPKILVLFAYTGGASLAARAAGADVVHVESLKQLVTWARENMEKSGLQNIRWTVEDAFKFVRRELKRGHQYQGVILDPPAFGRGPKGETWKLEKELAPLIEATVDLLDPERHFYLINAYSQGLSPLTLGNIIYSRIRPSSFSSGELYISSSSGQRMPAGWFASFHSPS